MIVCYLKEGILTYGKYVMLYEHDKINKDILIEYYQAQACASCSFDNSLMKVFKTKYPDVYRLINSEYQKRIKIKKFLDIMKHIDYYCDTPIYWFTLTWNNEKDVNLETTKRKEAFNFLDGVFEFFFFVEEHGEDNGRYHVHGFGVFWHDKGFEDFVKWHSRQNILFLDTTKKVNKRVRYLTNYTVKVCGRIRSNKRFVELCKREKKIHWRKHWSENFYTSGMREICSELVDDKLEGLF